MAEARLGRTLLILMEDGQICDSRPHADLHQDGAEVAIQWVQCEQLAQADQIDLVETIQTPWARLCLRHQEAQRCRSAQPHHLRQPHRSTQASRPTKKQITQRWANLLCVLLPLEACDPHVLVPPTI